MWSPLDDKVSLEFSTQTFQWALSNSSITDFPILVVGQLRSLLLGFFSCKLWFSVSFISLSMLGVMVCPVASIL